jgi:hypothetical protein
MEVYGNHKICSINAAWKCHLLKLKARIIAKISPITRELTVVLSNLSGKQKYHFNESVISSLMIHSDGGLWK